MDLDKAFVSSILKEGRDAVREAQNRGITEGTLIGDEGKKAYEFVVEYVSKYHTTPDPAMVQGRTGVKLDDPPNNAPAAFFIDEVLNRQLHKEMKRQLGDITATLKANDPRKAFADMEEALRELRKLQVAGSRTISLPKLGPEFLDYYEKLKSGHTGILTPWPTVNEATLGFWPEDFVLYVARLGVGKTWTLVMLADHAWHVQGKRVLFATTEMSRVKIAQRFFAVHFKLPYNDLRRGRLGVFPEQKLKDGINDMLDREGFYLIGGDFDFRIESLEAAIEECEPDIVFMDGAYLLKVSGEGRIEKAANSFDELKRVAKRHHVPLVASTQFNREVKSNKLDSAGAEKIALSDAAGWNADLIFGLVRTEDMRRDKRMAMKPLKFREGEGEDIECWWDFDTMTFDELPSGPQGGGSSSGGSAPTTPSSQGSGSGGSGPDTDVYGTGLLNFQDGDDKGPDDVPF